MNWRIIPIFTIFLLLAGLGRSQETYPIKLDFPEKAGNKYHLRAHGSGRQQMVMSVGTKTNGRTNLISIDLEGTIEVLQVDERGLEKKLSCAIEKCVADLGSGKTELFKKGDVIVATAVNRKKSYTLNNAEVGREASSALEIVLSIHTSDLDDDDVFGTSTPRKVGETWPINSDAAVKDLNSSGAPFQIKQLKGQSRLRGIKTFGGRQCLDIGGTVTSTELDLPPRPGLKLTEGLIEVAYDGLFPVGGQRLKETESIKARVTMEMETPNGTATNQVAFDQSAEKEFTR
ncbi:MAG TPA: hypothetical protein VL793_13720 [Patescibacteria group bacterium]|nr:hypothetical protein [Patescibacteria group bacterium]